MHFLENQGPLSGPDVGGGTQMLEGKDSSVTVGAQALPKLMRQSNPLKQGVAQGSIQGGESLSLSNINFIF